MGKVFMRNIGGSGGESARVLVTAPQGSSVVATKGSKSVNCLPHTEQRTINLLPDELQGCEYIQSSGTQWINSGYYPNSNTKCYGEFTPIGGSSWQWFFGARQMSTNSAFAVGFNMSYSRQLVLQYGSTDAGRISNIYCTTDINKIVNNGKIFTLNDSDSYTFTSSMGTSPYPIFIFTTSSPSGGAYGEYGQLKFYKLQFLENNLMRANFIPCYVKEGKTFINDTGSISSSGTIGLYDTVNGIFHINRGSGTFTKGQDKEYTETIIFNGYLGLLNEYGVWTVTATKGTDTASDTVEVTEATDYNLELAYQRLPAMYQEVTFLKSTGTQYYYIPLALTNYFKIHFKCRNLGNNCDSMGNENRLFDIWYYSSKVRCSVGNNTNGNISYSANTQYEILGEINGTQILSKVDNNSITGTTSMLPINVNFGIMCAIKGDTTNPYENGKIQVDGDIEIWTENTEEPQYRLVPCYLKSDSTKHTAGHYDLINDEFHFNIGTGYFEVGEDVFY